jgi:hypothetical protein
MRGATLVSAALLLTAYPPSRLPAQIGHPPEHSPYRDVKKGRSLIIGGGYLTGSQGVVDVGPSDGPTATARFEVSFGKPLAFYLETTYGRMSRYIQDPTQNQENHKSGPVKVNLGIAMGGVHLNLTGPKTWHGIAPYVGGAGGVVFANEPAADSSGYEFQPKGIVGPEVGIRWYLGRQLAIRTEARWMFWKLEYPSAYKQPSPDGSRVLDIGAEDSEWTTHPWVTVTLAWTL